MLNSNKMTLIATGLLVGALAYKFAPKLKMMAEEAEEQNLFSKLISMFTKKEEEAVPVEKPRIYDYGSIEIPEPVSGMGGRSIGQSSLETSVTPIAGIGQNSAGRIIGGY
tara:strand:- start:5544 stop:5873 length:330 start_codon:yes stop_codon:yes gene_type:complete